MPYVAMGKLSIEQMISNNNINVKRKRKGFIYMFMFPFLSVKDKIIYVTSTHLMVNIKFYLIIN